MNERIKELAEQAGFYVDYGKIFIPTTSEDITTCQQKFAELIVRECADVARDNTPDTEECQYTHLVSEAIKEHFGVEDV